MKPLVIACLAALIALAPLRALAADTGVSAAPASNTPAATAQTPGATATAAPATAIPAMPTLPEPLGRLLRPAPHKMYSTPDLTDKKYFTCKADNDCITASLPCGRVIVVNRGTHDDVQGWYNFINPRFQCLPGAPQQQAEKIACVKNMCSADIHEEKPLSPDAPEAKNPSYCNTVADCAIVLGPCQQKIVVNKIYQESMQKDYDRKHRMHMDNCFWPDNRSVKSTTCENNTCKIELEIPNQNHWAEPMTIHEGTGGRD